MSTATPAGVYAGWDYYQCPYCDRDSLDAVWMAEHIRLVHQIPQPVRQRVFACTQCPATFADADRLAEHVRLVHEIPQPVAEASEPATAPARRARRVTVEPAASETPEPPAVTTEE
jgi:hypothetical protein